MVSDASAITIEFIEEKRRSGIQLECRVRSTSGKRSGTYDPAERQRDCALLHHLVERAIDTLATEDGLLFAALGTAGVGDRGDAYALHHVLDEQAAAVFKRLSREYHLYVLTHEQFRQGGLPAWIAEVRLLHVWPLLPAAVHRSGAKIPRLSELNYLRHYAALTGRPGWMLSKVDSDAVPVVMKNPIPELNIDLDNIEQLNAIVAAFGSGEADQSQQSPKIEFSLLADRAWRVRDRLRVFWNGLVACLFMLTIWPVMLIVAIPIYVVCWCISTWQRLMRRFH